METVTLADLAAADAAARQALAVLEHPRKVLLVARAVDLHRLTAAAAAAGQMLLAQMAHQLTAETAAQDLHRL